MRDDRDAVVIGAIDWSRFAESVQTARPTNLFDRIPEATTATSTGMRARAASSDDALREQLGGLSVRERTRRLSDLVRTKIADLLGYRDRAELDLTRSFREIGFDSVLAVEFRNHLNKATNLVLPSSLVFDYPSATQLVAHLTTYFEDHAPARSAVELTAGTDAEVIQFISDQFGIT